MTRRLPSSRRLSHAGRIASALAALLGAGAVAGLLGGLGWLAGALAALCLAVVVVLLVLEGRAVSREEESERERAIRRVLVRWPLTAAAAEPAELGVAISPLAEPYRHEGRSAPYVERDGDAALRAALRTHGFVLVVGPSRAGKSRSALEALRDGQTGLAGRPLIAPRRPGASDRPHALHELAELEPPFEPDPRPAVLWLDDIDEFLTSGELDLAALAHWRAGSPPRAVVLGTLREGRLEELRTPSSELRSAGQASGNTLEAVLGEAHLVTIDGDLSESERARALALYPDQAFDAAGIGERLTDAPGLVERVRLGMRTNPGGVAVVRAAVDWRRAGVIVQIPRDALAALAPIYAGAGPFEPALTWATTPLESGAAALRSDDGGTTFAAYDYLVDLYDGRLPQHGSGEAIPAALWQPVIDRLEDPGDLLSVGISAFGRGEAGPAREAWSRAARSDDPHAAPVAALGLGTVLMAADDGPGARAAFAQAIDSEHAEAAPRAALGQGILLHEEDPKAAMLAYRTAIASGNVDAVPLASLNLGMLLDEQGDGRGAAAEYRRAVASDHAYAAPMAAVNLGVCLAGDGDLGGARAAFEQAIASEHPEAAGRGERGLRDLVERPGLALYDVGVELMDTDPGAAHAALEQAVASGHPDVVAAAQFSLGDLLRNAGDPDAARSTLEAALDSGHPEVMPLAAHRLGLLLEEQGDLAGAEAAFRRSDVPDAALRLGVLLHRRGDIAGAETAWRLADDGGDAAAAANLGVLLKERGEIAEAAAAFRRADDRGNAGGAFALGVLLHARDDLDGAGAAWRRAAERGDAGGAFNLGVLLEERGDRAGAEQAYRQAEGAADGDLARQARDALDRL